MMSVCFCLLLFPGCCFFLFLYSKYSFVLLYIVSEDLVFWRHLPVAIWNDQLYDNVAIFTGSATIVNSIPTIVYPGLCSSVDWPACNTGTVFAIALPFDYANDRYLVNWTKPSYNPIVENVQRDPSTAWQTVKADEWRFTNYDGLIYTSKVRSDELFIYYSF